MCSTGTAVLFYSKSYQHIIGWRAQRGVSWHQWAAVRQGGRSQVVGAPHMCCTSDEKLRCKTVLLSFIFSPYFIGHCVRNSWGSIVFFVWCCVDKPCLKRLLLGALQRHCTRGKHMLVTGAIVCFRPCANKMVALKVPVVRCANCSQAKGNDCCKQRTSSCFVSWCCRISGLVRFTDKSLFPEAKKNWIGPWSHQLFLQYTVCAITWTEKCMGGYNVHMSLRSLVCLFGHTGQDYVFTWATQDYYPTVCIVVQD